jgi:tetratricopeptide (TPR) repeat protein
MDLRNALTVVGQLAMCEGRYTDAMGPLRESLDICRRLGVSWQLGTSHLNFGNALLHSGHTAEAELIYRDGLEVYRKLGDATFAARMTNAIAHAALAEDDLERADGLARDSLRAFATQRERIGVAEALDTLAAVAAARADSERAARLSGASERIHETIASRPAPFERAISGRFIDASQAAAGPERWDEASQDGRELSLEAAINYALGGEEPHRPNSSAKRTPDAKRAHD